MHRVAVAVCACAAVVCGAVTGMAAQDSAAPPVPSIVTFGEGVVRRAPDVAWVVAAVESRARNPRDAQRQNAEVMTAVQQRLAAANLGKDAVSTLGYTIQQEVDFVNGRRVPREYVARNAIEIRIDAVERAGEILDAVVQAGATSTGGVRFALRDRAAVEREALRLAVADARARADAAAAGAGRAVDRVLRIDDTRQPRVFQERAVMSMARGAADATSETPIEPGVIEIRADVTLTVAIK
jgi:uncharacterized protein YggE